MHRGGGFRAAGACAGPSALDGDLAEKRQAGAEVEGRGARPATQYSHVICPSISCCWNGHSEWWMTEQNRGMLFEGDCYSRVLKQWVNQGRGESELWDFAGIYSMQCKCSWCVQNKLNHQAEVEIDKKDYHKKDDHKDGFETGNGTGKTLVEAKVQNVSKDLEHKITSAARRRWRRKTLKEHKSH